MKPASVISWGFLAVAGICGCIGQKDYRFLSTPGTIYVLENTTAVFNWTHTVNATEMSLIWEYRGTPEKPLRHSEHVLHYVQYSTGNRTFHPWKNTNYTYSPGSAIMTMDQVSQKEAGRYKLRVTDVGCDKTIYGNATMVVISVLCVYSARPVGQL